MNRQFMEKDGAIMMIRMTAKSVYYPVSGRRAEVIRGSARVRYVRGSLLVNAKCLNNQ
jgi:hypothetical protein